MALRLLRRREAQARLGKSNSSFYRDIADGLFPPGVHTSVQTRGWPEDEVDAVISARIAGKSDQELRELVTRLVDRRREAA